jgi:NTE family protein
MWPYGSRGHFVTDIPLPKVEVSIPSDHEGVKDRKNDLAYSDKTDYDQKVAVLISDYIDLAKNIRKIALEHIPQNK